MADREDVGQRVVLAPRQLKGGLHIAADRSTQRARLGIAVCPAAVRVKAFAQAARANASSFLLRDIQEEVSAATLLLFVRESRDSPIRG